MDSATSRYGRRLPPFRLNLTLPVSSSGRETGKANNIPTNDNNNNNIGELGLTNQEVSSQRLPTASGREPGNQTGALG